MANNNHFRAARRSAKEAYLAGNTDVDILAETYGVSTRTVYNWVKTGRWEEQRKEDLNLDQRAEVAAKRALAVALEEFAADPRNTDLRSLVAFLRSEQKRQEPAKELNSYIIKFLDQLTDYLIEREYPGLLKEFQAFTIDLAEYLRLRNS